MSDKERLKEIKKELELYRSNIFYVVNQDDMKWLINRVEELVEENDKLVERVHKLALDWSELVDENNELAERVEELEKEKDEWKYTAQSYYMTNQELREQNKRLRKALEFYADKKSWMNREVTILMDGEPTDVEDCPAIFDDGGNIARKALEGEE